MELHNLWPVSESERKELRQNRNHPLRLDELDLQTSELLRLKQEAEEALARWERSDAPEAVERIAEYAAIVLDVTGELQSAVEGGKVEAHEAPDREPKRRNG